MDRVGSSRGSPGVRRSPPDYPLNNSRASTSISSADQRPEVARQQSRPAHRHLPRRGSHQSAGDAVRHQPQRRHQNPHSRPRPAPLSRAQCQADRRSRTALRRRAVPGADRRPVWCRRSHRTRTHTNSSTTDPPLGGYRSFLRARATIASYSSTQRAEPQVKAVTWVSVGDR